MNCPCCSKPMAKVIYYGFPHRLCMDEKCSVMVSPPVVDLLVDKLPFNGWMVQYEGSYWRALWHWLRGEIE